MATPNMRTNIRTLKMPTLKMPTLKMPTLGIIGHGNIAKGLLQILRQKKEQRLHFNHLAILTKPGGIERARQMLELNRTDVSPVADTVSVDDDLDSFCAHKPDLVVECAAHSAVSTSVISLLEKGVRVIIVSIGALGDDDLARKIENAAEKNHTQATIIPGAIGGIDVLAASRLSGIESVVYTSRKPPNAWRSTPAQTILDLDHLPEEVTFFEGNARQAAALYPKNANVAATLALAGIGFERTQVYMIADPAITENIHEYTVKSNTVNYTIRLVGAVSPDNPKTSMTTIYSAARAVLNHFLPVAI